LEAEDGNGISQVISQAFLDYSGKSNLSLIELFRQCDGDMDGIINCKEFMAGLSSHIAYTIHYTHTLWQVYPA
jgi:hypothetical protein